MFNRRAWFFEVIGKKYQTTIHKRVCPFGSRMALKSLVVGGEMLVFKKMEKRILIIFSLLCFAVAEDAYPIFELDGRGPRVTGMGGASVAVTSGADALFANPAGLAKQNGFQTTFMTSKPFGLDVRQQAFVCGTHVASGGLGFSYSSLGNQELLTERVISVGYGSDGYGSGTGRIFSFGIVLKSMSVDFGDTYGKGCVLSMDAGVLVDVNGTLHAGAMVNNWNNPRLGISEPFNLPGRITVGIGWNPTTEFVSALDIASETDYPVELHFGVEFRLTRLLLLRAGVQTQPTAFTTGFGVRTGRVFIDYGCQTHEYLNVTHQFSCSFRFGTRTPADRDANQIKDMGIIFEEE